ncbi:hypothetical protein M8818_005073 [Zalaria obscura]|uniref:Uncharacterized protein n=1 Tax=Zalaria obscura TaxID=2024903 RepID=A0ACC3SAI4_9PEZI
MRSESRSQSNAAHGTIASPVLKGYVLARREVSISEHKRPTSLASPLSASRQTESPGAAVPRPGAAVRPTRSGSSSRHRGKARRLVPSTGTSSRTGLKVLMKAFPAKGRTWSRKRRIDGDPVRYQTEWIQKSLLRRAGSDRGLMRWLGEQTVLPFADNSIPAANQLCLLAEDTKRRAKVKPPTILTYARAIRGPYPSPTEVVRPATALGGRTRQSPERSLSHEHFGFPSEWTVDPSTLVWTTKSSPSALLRGPL